MPKHLKTPEAIIKSFPSTKRKKKRNEKKMR